MSMLISESYAELNRQLHEQRHDYGIGGHKHAAQVLQLCELLNTKDVLDYGCGKAILEDKLDFKIQNYDPALEQYSKRPVPADIVVCTDVLEHIEPECLDAVLGDLQVLTIKMLLCTIATRPASKFLPDGRNAHLIQKDLRWWMPKLWDRFTIHSMNNLGGQELFVLCGSRGPGPWTTP